MADGDGVGAMLPGDGKELCTPPDELLNAQVLHSAVVWCACCLHVLPVATSTLAKAES